MKPFQILKLNKSSISLYKQKELKTSITLQTHLVTTKRFCAYFIF